MKIFAITKSLLLATGLMLLAASVAADPISASPRYTFAGNLNFTAAGGSLRTQPNTGNSCAVTNTDTATLTGIPAGATVVAAYLYWAGSGPTPDLSVTFRGSTITASRSFTENYSIGGISLDFFSGFADVTSLVTGNGSYTFANLTVTNTDLGGGGTYCSSSAVLAGWGLAVVYSQVTEPLRVINLFDGFQAFRGSQIVLNPSNFVVPVAPVEGRIGILSWEGDVENSAPFNGVTENLRFDGQSTPGINLTDAMNPTNNQFNSTINLSGSTTDYGVDLDVYDLTPHLRAGDSNAQTTYASGGDLVLLSLEIIAVTNTAAADLSITKSHVGDFAAGSVEQFDLQVSNLGPSVNPGPVTITDTLAGGLTYQSYTSSDTNWNCTAAAQLVTCQHPGPLAPGAGLASVGLNVLVDPSAAPSVVNTASVSSATFDPVAANNSSTDTATVVVPELSTSTKSVVDLNGLPVMPGDTLRYTISVTESAGADVSGVSVTDALDPLLTNLVVVNAAGGTDNSTGTTLQVDDLSVPAVSTIDVVFDADVVATATTGAVIANSADITNPVTIVVTTVSSPDQTVGGVPPASGIKNVYFGDIGGTTNAPALPMVLSRIPLTVPSNPVRVRIRRQDNDRVWALTPVLQAPLTLDGTAVPVRLQMRRNNNTSNRNIRVSLSYTTGGPPTLLGCADQVLTNAGGLSNAVTREFAFAVPRTDTNCNPIGGGPVTIPAGAVINVQVDNEPTLGPSGQAVFVYPFNPDAPGTSRAELPATTVINVDSIAFMDGAFPGGASQTGFPVGATLYVRGLVSDPFGTFDISSVIYRVLDPTGTPVQGGAMAQVQDTGAATATYEIAYAIPPGGPVGNWTAELTANEGSEGTVRHVAAANFAVFGDIRLEKQVRTLTDPISGASNPKSIPGASVEYLIRVTNESGVPLENDTVVISDTFPGQLRIFFGNPVTNPFVFTDGTPSSGLSFSFISLASTADDVRFSNDGGSNYITPTVDGFGYDATVPPINLIELTPGGVMAANTGSGDPSFEVTFEARVE